MVQIMACRLLGTKPLSEPMITYNELAPKEQNSVKFLIKIRTFPFTKMRLKMPPGKWWLCCLGLNVLKIFDNGKKTELYNVQRYKHGPCA